MFFRVTLQPNCPGEFTFPLQCHIKGMTNPLTIPITARVSQMSPRVLYSIETKGHQIFEAHYDRDNILDLGRLSPNKPCAIKFKISNKSDVTFHYTWNLEDDDPKYSNANNQAYLLTVSKESDHVSNVYESTCSLQLVALKRTMIRQHPITLKVSLREKQTCRLWVDALTHFFGKNLFSIVVSIFYGG